MRVWLTAGFLLLLLAFSLGGIFWASRGMADAPVGLHGYIALGLGGVLLLLITGGLMGILFYSARHGHDDKVGALDPESED